MPSPDVLTMLLLMVPLVLLYFVTVGVCLLLDVRRARKQAAEARRMADELGIDVSELTVPFVDVELE